MHNAPPQPVRMPWASRFLTEAGRLASMGKVRKKDWQNGQRQTRTTLAYDPETAKRELIEYANRLGLAPTDAAVSHVKGMYDVIYPPEASTQLNPMKKLTPFQQGVLKLVQQGYSFSAIAGMLNRSLRSVEAAYDKATKQRLNPISNRPRRVDDNALDVDDDRPIQREMPKLIYHIYNHATGDLKKHVAYPDTMEEAELQARFLKRKYGKKWAGHTIELVPNPDYRMNPVNIFSRSNDLGYNQYRISGKMAGMITKPYGGLPRHGYERFVNYQGHKGVVRRGRHDGKAIWIFHDHGEGSYEEPQHRINPVTVRKLPSGKCRVRTPRGVKAYGTTCKKAKAQARLLRGIEHGMKPRRLNPTGHHFRTQPLGSYMASNSKEMARHYIELNHLTHLTVDKSDEVRGQYVLWLMTGDVGDSSIGLRGGSYSTKREAMEEARALAAFTGLPLVDSWSGRRLLNPKGRKRHTHHWDIYDPKTGAHWGGVEYGGGTNSMKAVRRAQSGWAKVGRVKRGVYKPRKLNPAHHSTLPFGRSVTASDRIRVAAWRRNGSTGDFVVFIGTPHGGMADMLEFHLAGARKTMSRDTVRTDRPMSMLSDFHPVGDLPPLAAKAVQKHIRAL